MRPTRAPSLPLTVTALLILVLLPVVLAHNSDDHEMGHGMEMGMGIEAQPSSADEPLPESEYPPTYFSHPEHTALIYAHIILMIISWIFILPIAVMLSIVSSRHTIITQFIFSITNGLGIFFSMLYNAQTPDLYPRNAHHSIGWIVSTVASTQASIAFVGRLAKFVRSRRKKHSSHGGQQQQQQQQEEEENQPFVAARPRQSMHIHGHGSRFSFSHDSGRGSDSRTNSVTETLQGDEEDGPVGHPFKEYHQHENDEDDDDDDDDNLDTISLSRRDSTTPRVAILDKVAAVLASPKVWKYFDFAYKFIDRIILPFGFIAFATGIITFGRFFEGPGIFSGLAHWIKGGVFFWLGLFNLGRWCGSFADLGWAWNVRPDRRSSKKKKKKNGTKKGKWQPPSAEFVESFLIFFYGSTNIFLEHLGRWGGTWSAQDLEHVSITVLFIGGGLLGMLIESTSVRDVLNITASDADTDYDPARTRLDSDTERLEPRQPETYEFSMNPIPCLVILLLGIMMSSHHQPSMISTMVHKQWGNLLTGASFARGMTYILVYLRPPKSIYPSRPPTELLSSFGLIAGGIIFMASSSDTIDGMIHYRLDAMFMYTVTMGLVGLLMAWEVFVLAVKGWALRKERRLARYRFS